MFSSNAYKGVIDIPFIDSCIALLCIVFDK